MDVLLFPTRFSRINSTRKNRYYGSSIYTGEYYKSQAASSEKGRKKIKREMVGGSRIGSIYNSEKLTWMSCGIDRPAQVITRPWDGRTGQQKKKPNVTDAYTYFLGRYVGRTLSNQTKISK